MSPNDLSHRVSYQMWRKKHMVNLEKNRVCRWRTWSISPRRARNERRIFDAAVTSTCALHRDDVTVYLNVNNNENNVLPDVGFFVPNLGNFQKFSILELKMASFGAFWLLFLQVSCLFYLCTPAVFYCVHAVCVCCGCYLSVSVSLSSCNFSKQFVFL